MTLNDLIQYEYGDCYFKRRDIDIHADKSVVQRLALDTDTDFARAEGTSLYLRALPISTFERNVYSAEWVLNTNNIYSTRRTYGMCYCPLCLKEDEEPYYRVDWRLSFVTMCLKHNCLLVNKCPHCKEEINLYRLPITAENQGVCCWCGKSIIAAPAIYSSCFRRYSKIQAFLISILNKAKAGDEMELARIKEYFMELYMFCFLVSQQCRKVAERCLDVYQELSELLKYDQSHLYFDAYPPIIRLIVLDLAFTLFEQDSRCNFKIHARLRAAEDRRIHLVKQIPCGQWCEDHDYLKISKVCKRFIAEALI